MVQEGILLMQYVQNTLACREEEGAYFGLVEMDRSNYITKGQLISKCPFGVFNSPKKPTKFFPEFLQ